MKYLTKAEDMKQDAMMEKKIDALKALIGRMYAMEMGEDDHSEEGEEYGEKPGLAAMEISIEKEPEGRMAKVGQAEEEARKDQEEPDLKEELRDYMKGFTLPKKSINLRRV